MAAAVGLMRQSCGPLFFTLLQALMLIAWALAVAPAVALAEPSFPALTGRVVDNAKILKPADIETLTAELAELEAKSSDQLVVVTLRSLEGYDIAEYGYQLGRAWGIGRAGVNNGALLIVAPKDRKVRIEVGRGLEPVLTDLMTHIIIENAIIPKFRSGDFSGGILDGVRDIKATMLGDAEAVKERARGRAAPEDDWIGVIVIAIWISIVIFIMWRQYRYREYLNSLPESERRARRYARNDGVFVPLPGGASGGWGSGGGGSSGGWSGGGGGDFGGGGSSGSW